MTPGIARVVFLDVEDDLHQVRPDVGDLGEDAARDAQRRRAQRLADGKADEARAGVLAGNEQQDAQHDQQLDADEQHADAHARLERNGVDRVGLAFQAGKGRSRVRERVDADAEPGDAVAAGNADEAEEQDDGDPERPEVQQRAEVERDDRADEQLEQQDELALRDQVRLARLVDQLGHFEHRRVHGQVLELRVEDQPEQQPEHRDHQTGQQQGVPVDAAKETDAAQIGQDQIDFTARGMRGRLCRLRGYHRRRHADEHRRDHRPDPLLHTHESILKYSGVGVHSAQVPGFTGSRVHRFTGSRSGSETNARLYQPSVRRTAGSGRPAARGDPRRARAWPSHRSGKSGCRLRRSGQEIAASCLGKMRTSPRYR